MSSLILYIIVGFGFLQLIPILGTALLLAGFGVMAVWVKIDAVVSSLAPGYQSDSSDQTSTAPSYSPSWFSVPNPTSAEIAAASEKQIHPVLLGCLLESTQRSAASQEAC